MTEAPSLAGRQIAMTGATSHTGRRLAARLLDEGAALRCMVHTAGNEKRLPASPDGRLTIVQGSADCPGDLERLVEGCDTLVHLSGQRFTPGIVQTLGKRQEAIRLIVQSSTRRFSQFDTPTRRDVMASEASVERAVPPICWTILRPAMIFGGPDDNNIERLAAMLRKWRCFPVFGRGENLIQPLFVLDLVEAHLAALKHPEASSGRSYTLAGPAAMAYGDFVRKVAKAAGVEKVRLLRVPRKPALRAAACLHFVWRCSPVNPEAIERFGEDRAFDIGPAINDLGFSPTAFERALAQKFARKV